MSEKITDYHQFELWRYDDNTVDLNCFRAEFDVDPHVAYMESLVIARSIGETIYEEDEVFSVSVFEQGTVSTRWRDGDGEITSWQHFRWIKERLFNAGYSGLIDYPPPPRRLMLMFWGVEYLVARVLAPFKKKSQQEEPVEQTLAVDMSNVVVLADRLP